jgi:hypothetical protein
MSCWFSLVIADSGLRSFSATGLGFAADLADAFFDLDSPFSEDFPDDRFRVGFLVTFASNFLEVSFRGIVVVVVRALKKALETDWRSDEASVGRAYWLVTISVMVRGFFLGALPFSGDALRLAG